MHVRSVVPKIAVFFNIRMNCLHMKFANGQLVGTGSVLIFGVGVAIRFCLTEPGEHCFTLAQEN